MSLNSTHFAHGDEADGPVGGAFGGAVVAVWGLTFKAGTDGLRNSPAVEISLWLAKGGAAVRA